METANKVRTLPAPRARPLPTARLDLSSVWFALEARPWAVLALIPSNEAVPSREVAVSLLEVGVRASPEAPTLIDAAGLTPDGVAERLAELEQARATSRRAVILVDPPARNAAALALIRRSDVAVLCVGLGDSSIEEARRTIDLCGRERFVGTVVLREEG